MDAGWQIAFDKGLGGEVVFQGGVTKYSVLEARWGGGVGCRCRKVRLIALLTNFKLNY